MNRTSAGSVEVMRKGSSNDDNVATDTRGWSGDGGERSFDMLFANRNNENEQRFENEKNLLHTASRSHALFAFQSLSSL